MAEYIEREAAKKTLGESGLIPKYAENNRPVTDRIIDGIPAADVVEVVRCKDCKHYGWAQEPCHGRTERYCKLNKGLVVISKETFCSYGERRGEDGQKKSL